MSLNITSDSTITTSCNFGHTQVCGKGQTLLSWTRSLVVYVMGQLKFMNGFTSSHVQISHAIKVSFFPVSPSKSSQIMSTKFSVLLRSSVPCYTKFLKYTDYITTPTECTIANHSHQIPARLAPEECSAPVQQHSIYGKSRKTECTTGLQHMLCP